FGGSSVASAEQIKKVASIIGNDSSKKFIVVSAPGKRSKEDIKITDTLIAIVNHYKEGKKYDTLLNLVYDRFHHILKELQLSTDIALEMQTTIQNTLNENAVPLAIKMDTIKS